ncbi:MAG: hypothetical protein ABI882_14305, partial [Acidobacteriota bacterium]
MRQIEALTAEKESRSPAQQKIDSQLLLSLKRSRQEPVMAPLAEMTLSVEVDADGAVLVDISA